MLLCFPLQCKLQDLLSPCPDCTAALCCRQRTGACSQRRWCRCTAPTWRTQRCRASRTTTSATPSASSCRPRPAPPLRSAWCVHWPPSHAVARHRAECSQNSSQSVCVMGVKVLLGASHFDLADAGGGAGQRSVVGAARRLQHRGLPQRQLYQQHSRCTLHSLVFWLDLSLHNPFLTCWYSSFRRSFRMSTMSAPLACRPAAAGAAR
jgi:hypothetical protein